MSEFGAGRPLDSAGDPEANLRRSGYLVGSMSETLAGS